MRSVITMNVGKLFYPLSLGFVFGILVLCVIYWRFWLQDDCVDHVKYSYFSLCSDEKQMLSEYDDLQREMSEINDKKKGIEQLMTVYDRAFERENFPIPTKINQRTFKDGFVTIGDASLPVSQAAVEYINMGEVVANSEKEQKKCARKVDALQKELKCLRLKKKRFEDQFRELLPPLPVPDSPSVEAVPVPSEQSAEAKASDNGAANDDEYDELFENIEDYSSNRSPD